MTKSSRNPGKPWESTDVKELRALAKGNTPTRVIGLKLGRTEGSVHSKAGSEGISLKPTNQSPYGTKKKYQRFSSQPFKGQQERKNPDG